ncbi:MAG: nodulation protein NfeD [Actinomycetota bacterium]
MRNAPRPVLLLGMLLTVLGLALAPAHAQEPGGTETTSTVLELQIDGVVDPFVADYVEGRIDQAPGRADAVLITIDTPGGLDSSMRQIVQAISNTSVPVVCYVAPEGARAASAGMYILLSCPVAAMAPGTNVGAATPVGLSGAIASQKAVEDSVAYARALAEAHDRDADWAEQAVRDAVSLSAEQALERNVIDIVAADTTTLLDEIDGEQVEVAGDAVVTLETAGAQITTETLGPFIGFLHALLDPNLAFLFFWLGIGLMILEFFLPHFGIAGVIGFVLLLLSIAAFGMLPVRLVGVLLLIASAVLLVLEIHTPGFGVFGIGGIIGLVVGGLLLFNGPGVRVSPVLIVIVAAAMVGFFGFVLTAAMKLRGAPPVSDPGDVVGREGKALTDLAPTGVVHVHGEEWSASAPHGALSKGTRVRVLSKEGLRLEVEPAESSESLTGEAHEAPTTDAGTVDTEKEGSAT